MAEKLIPIFSGSHGSQQIACKISLVSGRRTTFPRTSGFVDIVVDVERVKMEDNGRYRISQTRAKRGRRKQETLAALLSPTLASMALQLPTSPSTKQPCLLHLFIQLPLMSLLYHKITHYRMILNLLNARVLSTRM